MTPTEAAWVRENAWLPEMRQRRSDKPHPYQWDCCACEMTECIPCRIGNHAMCQRLKGGPVEFPEGRIQFARRGWLLAARFPEPHTHHDPRSFWGIPNTAALVFLADRICRWACSCECPPADPRPVVVEQMDLFAEAAS